MKLIFEAVEKTQPFFWLKIKKYRNLERLLQRGDFVLIF